MPLQSGLELLALLSMGHFLGDFGLQSDRMAAEKCRGQDATLPWQWWLTAHAAIHGLIVALLTGVPALGLAEWGAHTLIDYGKCQPAIASAWIRASTCSASCFGSYC